MLVDSLSDAAIIRYNTPYADHDGNPIQISFGLGNDMTVNTILGMPVIKDLGMIPIFGIALSPAPIPLLHSIFATKKLPVALTTKILMPLFSRHSPLPICTPHH
jgi:hypothetical protein